MVPAYLELLPIIPMTPSNKADRKNLPPPKGPRYLALEKVFLRMADEAGMTPAQFDLQIWREAQ